MSSNINDKSFFIEAMIRFVEAFGNENIGECEVDISKVMSFSNSFDFQFNMAFDCKTQDDYYKLVETMVLDGFPIWDFLRISEWTKNMLDREYENNRRKEEEENRKKYICYSCDYFKESITPLGLLQKCNKPIDKRSMRKRERFEIKIKCKDAKKEQRRD